MLLAFIAHIGENLFVALDAIGVIITENVALPSELSIALPAAEVVAVPVLVHCLGVFTGEDKLNSKNVF